MEFEFEICGCGICDARRVAQVREAAAAMEEMRRKYMAVGGILAAVLPPPEQTVVANRIPPVPATNRCVCCGRPVKDGQKVCGRLRCWIPFKKPPMVTSHRMERRVSETETVDNAIGATHRQARPHPLDIACKR